MAGKQKVKEYRPYDRAAATDVAISMGMVNTMGDLVTMTLPNAGGDERFKNICPECGPDDPTLGAVRYHCENGHGPMEAGDMLKAKQTPEGLIAVSKDEIAAAKESALDDKKLDLHFHEAAEIEASTYASGTAHIFFPSKFDSMVPLLLRLIDEAGHIKRDGQPDAMAMGLLKTRSEKLVCLKRWNGMLIFQEMIRPEDVRHFPEYPLNELNESHLPLATKLIEAQMEEFDPKTYRATARERIAILVEAAKTGQVPPPTAMPTAPAAMQPDFEALIMASINAAEKQKAS